MASLIAEIIDSRLCESRFLALFFLDSIFESLFDTSFESSSGMFDLDTASASFSGDEYDDAVTISLELEHLVHEELLPSLEPKKLPHGHFRRIHFSSTIRAIVRGSRG